MKKISTFFLAVTTVLALSSQLFAADSKMINWKIDNSKSKVEFIADQNSSLVNGSFEDFSGVINFDKANLQNSNVAISINLNSVKASLPQAVGVLKEDGWFNVKQFPNAEFKSQKFTQIAENKYHAAGILKLKGVEIPTEINFLFEKYSSTEAVAVGYAKINRLDFKVGKKDENSVKDLVTIKFTITAHN